MLLAKLRYTETQTELPSVSVTHSRMLDHARTGSQVLHYALLKVMRAPVVACTAIVVPELGAGKFGSLLLGLRWLSSEQQPLWIALTG